MKSGRNFRRMTFLAEHNGYIDEKKLGVTGGSGGGVLTNWTVSHTKHFAAAVSQRDISDWATWWYTADFTLFSLIGSKRRHSRIRRITLTALLSRSWITFTPRFCLSWD